MIIFAGGHVSGGHYNPAVSLAVYVRGDKQAFTLGDMVIYSVVQLVAGFIAAMIAIWLKQQLAVGIGVHEEVAPDQSECRQWSGLDCRVPRHFRPSAYTVLNVATAKGTSSNSFYDWAIGMAVMFSAYAFGGISGGAFNPAVAVWGLGSWVSLGRRINLFVARWLRRRCGLVFHAAHPVHNGYYRRLRGGWMC